VSCKAEGQKGKRHSEETIRKRIASMTGKKRKPLTEEVKTKISKALVGRKIPDDIKEKVRLKVVGRKLSPTARKNIGLGKIREKNPNWKGGVDKDKRKMKTAEYRKWRHDVFCRDWFVCHMPLCDEPGNRIEAHHIKTYKEFPELKLDVNNGITLCKECHKHIKGREKEFERIFVEVIKLTNL
jgi:hypothetical protein